MKEYTVVVTYEARFKVEAEDEDEAIEKVDNMSNEKIERRLRYEDTRIEEY